MKFLNNQNMTFRKTTLALGVLFALGSGAAAATTFATADTNGNGKISKDEYYGYVGDVGIYGDWDLNDDGLLDEDEWTDVDYSYDYDYDTWDLNDDGYLDDDEVYVGTFDTFDVDDDTYLDNDEWDDAGDEGWFDV
mgnify:CR=1 FL=1